jgi:hypothetical protein
LYVLIQAYHINTAYGSKMQDLDLYDESRTLVYSGPVSRRDRSEIDWHGWNDMVAALLDNNCEQLFFVPCVRF